MIQKLYFLLTVCLTIVYCSVIAQTQPSNENSEGDIREGMKQEAQRIKDPSTGKVPHQKLFQTLTDMHHLAGTAGTSKTFASGIPWAERGPNNQGGRTRTIMVDPNDHTHHTVFAASVSGGLWKTTQINSANPDWKPVNDLFVNMAIETICYDSANPKTMYFGTGEGWGNFDGIVGDGIFKSTDGGLTWTQLKSTANSSDFWYVVKILVAPKTGYVYAGTGTGVFRSKDGGKTWHSVLDATRGSVSSEVSDLVIGADDNLYVAMGLSRTDGIYSSVSGDSGTWVKKNTGINGFPTTGFWRTSLACAHSNADIIYAITADSITGTFGNAYRSSDKGATWYQLTNPSNANNGYNIAWQAWYELSIAVDPNHDSTVIIGGNDLYKSKNAGSTWTKISNNYSASPYNYVHVDQHAIVYAPGRSDTMYFGNDGGVYQSVNGGKAMISKDSNYRTLQLYACALSPTKGSNLMLGASQDNGVQRYINSGFNSANAVYGGDGITCFINQRNPKLQLAANTYSNYTMSKDSGKTWTDIISSYTGNFYNAAEYSDMDTMFYSADGNTSYRYWYNPWAGTKPYSYSLSSYVGYQISAIAASPTVSHEIFIGADYSTLLKVDNANCSTPTITDITGNLPSGVISCITIEPANPKHMLVTYSNYGVVSVWETTTGGNTWTSVEGNLPDMPVRWAIFAPGTSNKVLLATELGVWATDSLKGGSTIWSACTNGIANVRVDMLRMRPSDNVVIAATHGRGMYSTSYFTPATTTCSLTKPVVHDTSFCTANVIKLTAKGSSTGRYRWYRYALGGTAIDTFSTFTDTFKTTTKLYVSTINKTCESVRDTVTISYKNLTPTYKVFYCPGGSYYFNNTYYSTGGVYIATGVSKSGCDSIATLYLMPGFPDTANINVNLCTSKTYLFNGTAYSTAGTLTGTFTNKQGCDSTAIVHLTFYSISDTVNQTICPGKSYSFNGSSYSAAGYYRKKLKTKGGCDSTVTLHLSVFNAGTLTHTGKGCIGDTIIYNPGAGATTALSWLINSASVKKVNLSPSGTTVAGQKNGNYGNNNSSFNSPHGVFVSSSGNVYVSDFNNSRVQKWAPGATHGVTVAGDSSGYSGGDSTKLWGPSGIYVDANENIYICDQQNNRVQKWAKGAKYGTTVAGHKNCTNGYDSTALSNPNQLFVDASGNIYVSDKYNSRVQKWAPGATHGKTVVTGGWSTDSTGLQWIGGVYVDASGNIYTSSYFGNHVQKWAPGAKYGKIVAGHTNGTPGKDSTGLNQPGGLFVDGLGNLYIADVKNNRVQKWAPGANHGVTVGGHKKDTIAGTDSISLNMPQYSFVDADNNVFIADAGNNRVQMWAQPPTKFYYVTTTAGSYTVNASAGGCTFTTAALSIGAPNTATFTKSICTGQSFTVGSKSYTTSGIYTAHITNKSGCDSFVTLTLNVNKTSATTLSPISICSGSSYIYNGITYNTAGTRIVHFTNKLGCDSAVTFSLTLITKVTPTVSIAASPGTTILKGTKVTFTATPINGGTTPTYTWKKNGAVVGTNQSTYLDSLLNNNDSITCTLTSNVSCVTNATATSNKIYITIGTCGPITLTLSAGTGSNINASWTNHIGGYTIYYAPVTSLNTYASATSSTNSYTIKSPTAGTTYIMYVVDKGCVNSHSNYAYYNVTGGACTATAPNNLIDTSGITTIHLKWSGSSTAYQVYYKKVSASVWSSIVSTTKSYDINNLTASTCYVVFVTNKCTGSYGYSSSIDTFCTAASCSAPSTVTLTSVTCHGYKASWPVVSGVLGYQVYITRTTGSGSPSTNSYRTTTNSYTATGLTGGTGYSVYVKSRCSALDLSSTSSNTASTTTLTTGCKDAQEESIISNDVMSTSIFRVYPNPNSGQFTIDVSTNNATDNAVIKVTDVLGRVLIQKVSANNNGTIHTLLSNELMVPGVYLVHVQIGNESYIEHIVVQK